MQRFPVNVPLSPVLPEVFPPSHVSLQQLLPCFKAHTLHWLRPTFL